MLSKQLKLIIQAQRNGEKIGQRILPIVMNHNPADVEKFTDQIKSLVRGQLQAEGFTEKEIDLGFLKVHFGEKELIVTQKYLLHAGEEPYLSLIDPDVLYEILKNKITKHFPDIAVGSIQLWTDNFAHYKPTWNKRQLEILFIQSLTQAVSIQPIPIEQTYHAEQIFLRQQ